MSQPIKSPRLTPIVWDDCSHSDWLRGAQGCWIGYVGDVEVGRIEIRGTPKDHGMVHVTSHFAPVEGWQTRGRYDWSTRDRVHSRPLRLQVNSGHATIAKGKALIQRHYLAFMAGALKGANRRPNDLITKGGT